jgi:CheY-like chemotaxis protein
MNRDTVLYIFDQAADSHLALAAIKGTGCDVLSSTSSTQAMALLFIIHSVAGIFLNQRAGEQNSFDLARSLRALRPDVPIVLLCPEEIQDLPSCVNACVNTGGPLEKVTSAIGRLLTRDTESTLTPAI